MNLLTQIRSWLSYPNAFKTFPWDMFKIRTRISRPCPVWFLPTSSLRPLLLLPELPHPSLITSLKGAYSPPQSTGLTPPHFNSPPPPPSFPQIILRPQIEGPGNLALLLQPILSQHPVTALPHTQQYRCDSLINIYVSHETKLQGGKDHVHFSDSYFLST